MRFDEAVPTKLGKCIVRNEYTESDIFSKIQKFLKVQNQIRDLTYASFQYTYSEYGTKKVFNNLDIAMQNEPPYIR